MPLYEPLNLPWRHNVHDGVPVPPFITTERYQEIQEKHQSRTDDIFVATYQKSGTTWLQHILNQLFDEPQGKNLLIHEATPWLQASKQNDIDNMASPRIFKTHDRWRWIPKADGVKYIYCYRNPKDAAVSDYFQKRRLKFFGYEGTIDEFMSDIFLTENASENGCYFDHVAEWLAQKENKNILFLTYEDMVEDLYREVQKIVDFLKLNVDKEKINRIVDNSSFNAMKENNHVNYASQMASVIDANVAKEDPDNAKFMRKGKVGDWMNYISEKHSKEVEELVNKHLIPLGAKIRYSLQ